MIPRKASAAVCHLLHLKILQIADFTSVFPEKLAIFSKRAALFAAFYPAFPGDHSDRSTSIGFCCAARHAGYVPKTTPTNDEISSDPRMFVMEASVGISA